MNLRNLSIAFVTVCTACLGEPKTLAHDLWLLPPEKAELKKVAFFRANSGSKFPKSDHAPDPAKLKRRMLILPDGSEITAEAAGTDDNSGLLKFEPTHAGIYMVAVETEPKLLKLEADEFNNYLVSDGLPHIYQLRRKEGSLDKPARERYSKSPKAIVQVGTDGGGDACRVVGLPLEIVPLRSPFTLKVGDTLRVRVLFRDKPLADAMLGWDVPGEGTLPLGMVRTDSKGEALVPISQTGLMTIRLTHMTRPKETEYEWESFWTTLTFRIPE